MGGIADVYGSVKLWNLLTAMPVQAKKTRSDISVGRCTKNTADPSIQEFKTMRQTHWFIFGLDVMWKWEMFS